MNNKKKEKNGDRFIFINIGKPGPTDLTWDEKNRGDYCYYPVDLPKLKKPLKKKKTIYSNSKKSRRGVKMKIKIEERSQLYVHADECDEYGCPLTLDLKKAYPKLEEFLNEKSEKRILQHYKPFGDWFEDGIISSPSLKESYHIKECLLEHKTHSCNLLEDKIHGYNQVLGTGGIMHTLKIAGEPEKVDELFGQIIYSVIFYLVYSRGNLHHYYDNTSVKIYDVPDDFNLKSFNSISELEKALSPEDKKIETNDN